MRIIVEGGGPDAPFREGFKSFFLKFVPPTVDGQVVDLAIVRGSNGEEAVKKFAQHRKLYPDALIVLLMDSEGPVPATTSVWPFLTNRGGIVKPDWADETNLYLMVQCVEAWIVADPDALSSHYKSNLNPNKLPKRTKLEEEPKAEIQRKLKLATGGRYKHSDCADLIGLVGPAHIRKLPHGQRLTKLLVETIAKSAKNRDLN